MNTKNALHALLIVVLLVLAVGASIVHAASPDYTVTTTGNVIVVTDVSGNADTLTISEPSAGNIKFAAAGKNFSVDGGADIVGNSGDISLTGVTSITVNAATLADTLDVGAFTVSLPSLILNGGTGDDAVNLNGDITFASNANLDVDLLNDDASPGADLVTVAANANLITSGTGTITVKVLKNIAMASGSSFETVNGGITLNADVAGTGAFTVPAIDLNGANVITSGTGNVSLVSRGSTANATGKPIQLSNGAKILSTGSVLATQGKLTLSGTTALVSGQVSISLTGAGTEIKSLNGNISLAGLDPGNNSYTMSGIQVLSGASIESTGTAKVTLNAYCHVLGPAVLVDTASQVKSADGAISITGASIFIGNTCYGILIQGGSKVQSTGLATITMNGSGAGARHGVYVTGTGSKVTSVSGNISVTGNGGAVSNTFGIYIQNGAVVEGTGTANVTVSGNGSSFSSGSQEANGVVIDGASASVTTASGAINITGTGALGQSNVYGVKIINTGGVASTSGNITITGSANNSSNVSKGISYTSTTPLATSGTITFITGAGNGAPIILANGSISGTTGVTFRTNSSNTINLGATVDNVASTMGLSDAELDLVTTSGTLTIGDSSGGAITISAPITRPAATVMSLISAANIDISGGSLNSAGGNVTLNPGTNVYPSLSGVDVNTGASTLTITSGKTLRIVVNGATMDTGYTQFNVAGQVDLTGAIPSFSGTYVPVTGETYTIVNNDGADAIVGTFASLPEGGVTHSFLGISAKVSYVGGDGNDVVLTAFNANLSNLTLSSGTLTPAFAAATTSYTANVTNATTSITVTPTVSDPAATVTVNGVPVVSGNPSGPISLNVGSNVITTVVTATDATTTKTYTVTVTRQALPDYQVTTTGNAIVITDLSGNGETLTISEPSAGNIQFAAAARTFSVDGGLLVSNNSGSLSRTGVTSITVNAGGGNDTFTVNAFTGTLPSLTLNGGVGNDTLNLNGDITFAADANLDLDLQNDDVTPGNDILNVGASANLLTSGTGTITVKVSQSVSLTSGSSFEAVNGNITVEANQQATSTALDFVGINLNNGMIKSSGSGNISLVGKGGNNSGVQNNGIQLVTAGSVQSTGTGTITVTGTGNGTGANGFGVIISGANSKITSVSGGITLNGTGSASGSGGGNEGIRIQSSGAVTVNGSAPITINATKGNGTINAFVTTGTNPNRVGFDGTNVYSGNIVINADAMSISNAVIQTSGFVTLRQTTNGTLINLGAGDSAGTLGLTDAELDQVNGGTLQIGDSNSGAITVSAAMTHLNTNSILLTSPVNVRMNQSITTAGGSFTVNAPVVLGTNVLIDTTNAGGTAAGANINLTSTTDAELAASNRTLTLTAGTGGSISLGGTSGGTAPLQTITANGLGFTVAAIAVKTSGALAVTNTNTTSAISGIISGTSATLTKGGAGTLALGGANTYMGATTVNAGKLLVNGSTAAGSAVTVNNTGTLGGTGTVGGSVTVSSGGTLAPGLSPGILSSGNTSLASGSTFAVEIAGDGVAGDANGYDQHSISGSATINNATLTLDFTGLTAGELTDGQTFVIFNNDSNDAITGAFTGLAEGATAATDVVGSGSTITISYIGGTGNDVVLSVAKPCSATSDGNWSNPAVWNCAAVPGNGDKVHIGSGRTVILDADTADLKNVTLDGTLTNDGTAHTLSLTGDWTHSGTFTPGTFIGVTFKGSGVQQLINTNAIAFYNLTMNSGSILLERLSADNVTVNGTLTNNGTIRKSQTVSGTAVKTFGLAGAYNGGTLAINVTTQGTLSLLQVDRIDSNHPNAGTPESTGRYWNITPTGSGFTTNVTLPRSNAGTPTACRYTGTGTNWSCQNQGQTSNTVTRNGVTTFSPWAVGNNSPTAATLTDFSVKETEKHQVRVKWETGSELNVIGFNIYRATSKDGAFKKLNTELVAAKHPGEIQGDAYKYANKKVKAGKVYFYKLEIVNADGTSEWSDAVKVKIAPSGGE